MPAFAAAAAMLAPPETVTRERPPPRLAGTPSSEQLATAKTVAVVAAVRTRKAAFILLLQSPPPPVRALCGSLAPHYLMMRWSRRQIGLELDDDDGGGGGGGDGAPFVTAFSPSRRQKRKSDPTEPLSVRWNRPQPREGGGGGDFLVHRARARAATTAAHAAAPYAVGRRAVQAVDGEHGRCAGANGASDGEAADDHGGDHKRRAPDWPPWRSAHDDAAATASVRDAPPSPSPSLSPSPAVLNPDRSSQHQQQQQQPQQQQQQPQQPSYGQQQHRRLPLRDSPPPHPHPRDKPHRVPVQGALARDPVVANSAWSQFL
jgi:hypothetical protein